MIEMLRGSAVCAVGCMFHTRHLLFCLFFALCLFAVNVFAFACVCCVLHVFVLHVFSVFSRDMCLRDNVCVFVCVCVFCLCLCLRRYVFPEGVLSVSDCRFVCMHELFVAFCDFGCVLL